MWKANANVQWPEFQTFHIPNYTFLIKIVGQAPPLTSEPVPCLFD
jgi:hypothetical protein